MMTEIYLDGNATTAVLPAAIEAATQAMALGFGNPSSSHVSGIKANAMLQAVRQRAMRLLGVGSGRLMFNSGATEGIQTALLSALCGLRERQSKGERIGRLLLYGATEHKAVPESLAHWNRVLGLNLELKKLPVDGDGQHDLALLRVLANEAALVCTMAANNETGVVSDLEGIEAVLRQTDSDAYWLVDCVQALGKLALNLSATRIDYAPFSGHKLYAPKGIGMLYVRAGAPFTALMMGGGQESGQRSGTENMAGIAALGAVLAALEDGVSFRGHAQLHHFRDRLVASLRNAFPGIVFNMPLAKSLPTTLNFSVPGVASKDLLNLFDAAQVRVSSGSACSAAKAAASYVLEAMQLPPGRAESAIRMSFGPLADEAFISAACARIAHCGAALRKSRQSSSARPLHVGISGVTRFHLDGVNSWLVADAASRNCVIIDPAPALLPRLLADVVNQDYQVRAVVCSTLSGGAVRLELAQALAERLGSVECVDAFGWPVGLASTLELGRQTLVRMTLGDSHAYLLGCAKDGRFAASLAFIGELAPQAIATAIDADTLLCPARDESNLLCTTLRAEEGCIKADASLDLEAAALDQFLSSHPDAVLVDVREACEHAADKHSSGRTVLHAPLSGLLTHVSQWLREEPVPLVFFCRSGNRSSKAAACLRRLGYQAAWHVNGGIALGETVLLSGGARVV